jgi:hypothetical protein
MHEIVSELKYSAHFMQRMNANVRYVRIHGVMISAVWQFPSWWGHPHALSKSSVSNKYGNNRQVYDTRLKLIEEKNVPKIWTGPNWLRIRPNVGMLLTRWWTFGLHKNKHFLHQLNKYQSIKEVSYLVGHFKIAVMDIGMGVGRDVETIRGPMWAM